MKVIHSLKAIDRRDFT